MANITHLQLALTVLKRVPPDKFDMRQCIYQPPSTPKITNERELLDQEGATADFASWLALSPEFQTIGMHVSDWSPGVPYFRGCLSTDAIAKLFDIEWDLAANLCTTRDRDIDRESDLYNMLHRTHITKEHVMAILQDIIDGEYDEEQP